MSHRPNRQFITGLSYSPLTKAVFETTADVMKVTKEESDYATHLKIVLALAKVFEARNPAFNLRKWLEACGYPELNVIYSTPQEKELWRK